ncbi:MAG: sialate O-acetylesterase [Paraglaciecola sp.]|uniref:sialate O-acetylesterase n=1 Tax=Paraglaciecola sp. TaxID=1920173 RepID=UPI00329877C6
MIKGKAASNAEVTLTIAGQRHNTIADHNGQWQVTLTARSAGGPFTLHAFESSSSIKISDIYYGDVWLASGQSNMEWKLAWQVDNWQQEVQDSNFPLIRYFDVPNHYTADEQNIIGHAKWQLASPTTAGDFSAIAWLFAKQLHLEKGVPVAIIDSTWGGTPAEAWTPLPDLLKHNAYKSQANDLISKPNHWNQVFQQTRVDEFKKQQRLKSKDGHYILGLSHPNLDDQHWVTTDLPLTKPLPNVLWTRKRFSLTQLQAHSNGALFIGYTPSHFQVYLNGTQVQKSIGAQRDDPYILPKEHFIAGQNLIAFRAVNSWDNHVNIASKDALTLHLDNTQIQLNSGWKISNKMEEAVPMPPKLWQKPGVLYNAMIHPLIDFPLKGIIWYQGESNVKQATQYASLFTSLIQSWRERWGQAELPFVYAQLANIHAVKETPSTSNWALLREAQTQALVLPKTAMAVLIDAGDPWDIHPRNKQIVAQRLWQGAKKVAYNSKSVTSGPMVKEMQVEDTDLLLSFTDIGQGLRSKGRTLHGFEVAGKDGRYVNAQATIEGDRVRLHSPTVSSPISARYAWADNSLANLYNINGFPAVPFRIGE